jgi:hypothetical protein
MAAPMKKKSVTLTRNTLHVLDADTALPQVAGGGRRYTQPTSETARRGDTGGRVDQ